MEDQIFFKDKNNELKGPFTERQVQEWYRQNWFDSAFRFYFTQGDQRPLDVKNSGVTLEELRSYNGIGCPFRRIEESKKNEELRRREEGRKRLEKIEKEIADLKQKCTAVPDMEKSIEQVEKKLEGLAASLNKDLPKPVEKAPEVDPMQAHCEKTIPKIVLDALELYEKGTWTSWGWGDSAKAFEALLKDGNSRKAECERILVEKMKEKEFFCCILCQAIMFNYKQALVHFTSSEHKEKEPPILTQLGITSFRRLLDAFTDLPARLAAEDAKIEQERRKKYGSVTQQSAHLRPGIPFLAAFAERYIVPLCTGPVGDDSVAYSAQLTTTNMKSELGRRIMAELHEHIGQAKTWCSFCFVKTGDREGLYAHLVSSAHLKCLAQGGMLKQAPICLDLQTMAVNVHRKDLI